MATGASVTASNVEEPPLPGGRYPKETATACFTACGATSVSVGYQFSSSFSAVPSVWGGGPHRPTATSLSASIGNIYAASMTSSNASLIATTNDLVAGSFQTKVTFMFTE